MFLHLAQGLIVVGLVYPRVSSMNRARLTQSWAVKILRILNVVLAVHGVRPAESDTKLIVVSNHVSWLDIFVINATQPARFVAKSEIRDWPIAGWLCEGAGTIFVRRTKRRDTARINREIHDALADGNVVAIFPEGTTTRGDRLLKFHTSLFEPAVMEQANIAPVGIRYTTTDGEDCGAAAFVGETTFAESIAHIIAQQQMIAEVTFAPHIATTNLTRRDAAIAAEDAIASILNVPKPHTHQHFGDGAKVLPLL